MPYDRPQFFRVMRYARNAAGDVVDMVSGNPDWNPPPAVREGLRSYADGEPADFQYPPSAGLADLREEIATRRVVDRDRVLVTNGAGEANHLATAAALERHAGDEVVLLDPTYPYYPGRCALLGAETRTVPVDDDGHVDPERVRGAASEDTAAIVVNTPNNPTGAVYGADAMAALGSIADEHDAILVSDEVYDHFDYADRFASALETDVDRAVVTNSFSKTFAITGFRVGYAVFPARDGPAGDLFEAARTRHMLTNLTGSRPAQRAVLAGLRDTGPDYHERNRDRLRDRIGTFCDALESAGVTCTRPEGGFYVLARFPSLAEGFDGVETLIDEAGVAGMPGTAFGEAREGWVRFALVTPRVDEAADRLTAFVD